MALRPGELIASIRLRRETADLYQYGRKVGTRRAQAISKVSFAAVSGSQLFRIAVGSVAPVPMRCFETEKFLRSEKLSPAVIREAKTLLCREISPITDIRSTSDYRLTVSENLLGEFLEALL